MLDTQEIECPYCGELISLVLDASAGPQRYIEDCQVCCRPITVVLDVDENGDGRVHLQTEDDA
ncbi:CPXCG motif-containing cysteine-rich protein [Marilutibacter alkalisoli]|uniref:CPXCG motif-containing cysteine-rich protein n=1 Tax=Marilutibacter alkalisoli TaxID=2591633 RepID=UPI001FC964BF|nr:CPXCG motif-containing cysteine-rich protein [Lysobacter alkalisoli]